MGSYSLNNLYTWSFRGKISLMAVQKSVATSLGSIRPKSSSRGECFLASLLMYLTIARLSLMYRTSLLSIDIKYIMDRCKSSLMRNSLCFLPRYWRNVLFMLGCVSKRTINTCMPTWNVEKKTVKIRDDLKWHLFL